ncbi:DNA double-strand break repair nuclease NurA [Candidatus Woesearchaeota archaeon]|nr:DNA double-strand break repair nuclease NurA [Candidatus Woesearchaeota archaeon]
MLKEIIEEVSKRTDKAEGTHAVFSDRHHKPIEFSEDNYREIGSSIGKTLLFIDGGNAELLNAPGLSLQLVRNAAVIVKNNKLQKSIKREFYVLLTTEGRKEIKARLYSNGTKTDVVSASGNELAKFCESIRKSSEIKLATETANEGITVLDGTLEAANEMEKKHFDELYSEASKKGGVIAAIAKTTGLITDAGDSFPAMLNERGSGKAWYYHPVAEINSENHRAEMLFAKLHEKSSHVFRTEIYNKHKEKMQETMAELKENARELTFPGYPYGLILADRLARISEKEAKHVKAKIFAAAGNKWKNLKKSLAAVNAHEILDRMQVS